MDNPAAPISSTSAQPAVSSLPDESLNRHWLLWLAGGLAVLVFGVAIGVFSAKFLNRPQGQPQLTSTLTPAPSPQSPSPTPNSCTIDADCGVNICDCKADLNQNIPVAKKACARYCPGAPRCINNRCQLVDENK